MKKYANLAQRLFNTPLMVEPRKLEIVTNVFCQRIGVEIERDDVVVKSVIPAAALLEKERDRKPYHVTESDVAVIDVCGSLVNRASGMDWLSGLSSYEQLSYEVIDAATDPGIKGIMLRFDSCGGETAGAFDLADLIAQASQQKPTWASVDDSCFSAAYLMASQCARIYTTQTGGTGSVGVIAMHMDQSEFDASVGIKFTTIHAGARKADFNPHEPLKSEARVWLKGEIDTLYGMFVDAVARGRKMSADAVRKTEAGLFTGRRALEIGFADDIGTFREALDDLTAAIKEPSKSSGIAASAATEITKEGDMPKNTRADAEQQEQPIAQPPEDEKDKDPDDDEDEEKKKDEKMEQPAQATQRRPVATATTTSPLATVEDKVNLYHIAGKSLDDVQKVLAETITLADLQQRLISEKKAAQAPPTRSTLSPNANLVTALFTSAKELARTDRALTEFQHFARGMRANPQAYSEYLAANPAQTGGRRG